MTVSHWRRTLELGEISTEVLVVGAGICGVSAGLALQRRGVDYRIVERHTTGSGASTRNAGFLMRGAAENYKAGIDLYGRELAKLIWRWTEENLEGLRSEGIEQLKTYQRIPSCLLALGEEERDQLLASVQLLEEDGFAVEWRDRGDDTAWRHGRPLGGLINPHDAACNSYDIMRFLSAKLSGGVLEGQEVAAILPHGDGVRVRTSDAWITARHVLLCTNAYLPLLLPEMREIVTPRRGQMLAVSHPGLRLDCSYYANHGYEYFRQTTGGTVVVGGCRKRHAEIECGYEDRTTPEVQDDIEDFAERLLGIPRAELNITARWSGTMGFSPDWLPLAGPIPGQWARGSVWFCGAFTGHGMSMGYRTAHAAVDAMLDGGETAFPLSRVLDRPQGAFRIDVPAARAAARLV
jgi:glycine/D-amino acid oxidase-like deaminating enzyme